MKFDTQVVLGKELLGFVKLERSDFPERSKQLFLRSLKDAANWLGAGNNILKAPYIDPHYFPKLEFLPATYRGKSSGTYANFVVRLPIKTQRFSSVFAIRLNVYVDTYASCINCYSLSVQFWKEAPWQELTDLKSREDIFRFLRGFSTQCLQ